MTNSRSYYIYHRITIVFYSILPLKTNHVILHCLLPPETCVVFLCHFEKYGFEILPLCIFETINRFWNCVLCDLISINILEPCMQYQQKVLEKQFQPFQIFQIVQNKLTALRNKVTALSDITKVATNEKPMKIVSLCYILLIDEF